ncbi:SDR family oxidoreductase [Actinospica durhamensis]|uniref:SDR family oxidoreductase n=1 Tax=Actinospica durhamensis TaxID=1508375 RepID=A0A941EKA6_9ACTN|nr:SDR family oxidoreductase [Actinospica durhamensis]MBR7832921.1 SDR family oxidoreductase [Actinospica durhamensis]
MDSQVLVVIGVGGMGQAVARRLGSGRKVLIADFNETILKSFAEELRENGHDVATRQVDVSSRASVAELADHAAELGRVTHVVHTAGLSPVQAPAEAVLKVDLVGTALVLDEFARVIAPGGSGVMISSMSAYLHPGALTPEQTRELAHTPAEQLLELPYVDAATLGRLAYSFAKQANQIRVREASVAWGRRGARVNSVSPGVISTAMGRQELEGESGASMRAMVAASGTGRLGTPEDIAAAAAFLLGPDASFVTGTDLLVDGGVIAAVRSGHLQLGRG